MEVFTLKISVQIKSLGSKSGVNCTLLKPKSRHLLTVEIVRVFASPGSHSSKMCPHHKRQIIIESTKSFCQTIFCEISFFSSEIFFEASKTSISRFCIF